MNHSLGLKVDGPGQAGGGVAPGHDDVAALEVFLLADVQQQEGAVHEGGGDRVLLVGGLLSGGRRRQGERRRAVGRKGGSGLAPASDGGRAVVKVEAAGRVPRVLEVEGRCLVTVYPFTLVGCVEYFWRAS